MTNETEALVFLGGLEVKRSGVLTAVALVTAVVQVQSLAWEFLLQVEQNTHTHTHTPLKPLTICGAPSLPSRTDPRASTSHAKGTEPPHNNA